MHSTIVFYVILWNPFMEVYGEARYKCLNSWSAWTGELTIIDCKINWRCHTNFHLWGLQTYLYLGLQAFWLLKTFFFCLVLFITQWMALLHFTFRVSLYMNYSLLEVNNKTKNTLKSPDMYILTELPRFFPF